ncbi:MAG: GNAT family N-acetyltransferase [Vicinamibacterales bacterium]
MTAEVLESFDVLPGLRPEWERLFRLRPHEPSTSFEWTAAMARHHVRASDRGYVVRLLRDGVLVGLVPLVLRSLAVMGVKVRALTPLAETYNTHSDLLLDAPASDVVSTLVATLSTLGARWDVFRMARLLEDNPLVPVLQAALGDRGHQQARRAGLPAYVLALPDTYDAYLRARSAKFRNHLRRTERKLAAAGVVEVRELQVGEDFDAAYDALLQVERASWKQAHGTAITAVERQAAFYRDFGREAFAAGRLHVQWLSLDGRPIAYNLGYLTAGGYHYLKTSYDHDARALGPATVLRARLVEGLIARGVARLDFPGEPYEWESQWTDTIRWRTVVSGYARTLRGRVLAAVERVRHRHAGERRVVHVDPRAQRPPRPTHA